jgi:hypothetical protein
MRTINQSALVKARANANTSAIRRPLKMGYVVDAGQET